MKSVVVLLTLLGWCYGTDIECENFHNPTPVTGAQHFRFNTNANNWKPNGDPIRVTFEVKDTSPEKQILSFLIQAHDGGDLPVGKWHMLDAEVHHRLHRCQQDSDSLMSSADMPAVTRVIADWYPPQNDVGEIDFNAAVITVHNGEETLMNGIRSFTLKKLTDVHDPAIEESQEGDNDDSEEEAQPPSETGQSGTGEDPNEGERLISEQEEKAKELDHQAEVDDSYRKETEAMLKYKEKIQKEIADEDAESEGDWVREEQERLEQEERERDDEMMKYEVEMAEEEAKRQHMMQLEIKDKEEHDRLMAEQERTTPKPNKPIVEDENEVDEDEIKMPGDKDTNVISDLSAGVSRTAISLTCLLMSVLFMLF